MAISITVITNFPEVGGRLIRAGEAAPAVAEESLLPTAEIIKDAVVPIMASHTPVRSGTLQASTMGEVTGDGGGAIIDIRQPATNADGVEYVQWVVGGRGEVFPINKQALASADGSFGPVKHAGPAAANNYPSAASGEMQTAMDWQLELAGLDIGRHIIELMR